MDTTSVSSQPELQGLILEVRDLQQRLTYLERRFEQAEITAAPALAEAELPQLAVSADVVPVLGRALLGLAGAYLLRALTELGTLPRSVGVACGMRRRSLRCTLRSVLR